MKTVYIIGAGFLTLAAARAEDTGDPFVGVAPAPQRSANAEPPEWGDNWLFRREAMAVTAVRAEAPIGGDVFTRLSAGFEIQKRFATATRTVATANYQGRAVWRGNSGAAAFDSMAMDAAERVWETHNAYVDIVGVYGAPGVFNLRVGRFYIPFGLNIATDTHGTLLQLSNDRVFGTDRDGQLLAFGSVGALDYWAGYLFGAGPDLTLDGQSGLAAARIGLGSGFLYEHGLEGGLSAAWGERLDPHHPPHGPIRTWRAGADARQRWDSAAGPATIAVEAAIGADEGASLRSGLIQAEWRSPSRRWGVAAQYAYLTRDTVREGRASVLERSAGMVFSRYFRNDPGNAHLHWLAVGVERPVGVPEDASGTRVALQYYRYW